MSCEVKIVMGSKSDLPVMKDAAQCLEALGVKCDVQILSAHRTPELLEREARRWESLGVQVVVAGAGGAAHLPGMLASFTFIPVLGVPVMTKALKGLDSLLSIAQMPKGIPVGTLAINNAYNAGLLAARILAQNSTPRGRTIQKNLKALIKKQHEAVLKDRKKLKKLSWGSFLKSL